MANLKHNRQITIATAPSRKSVKWVNNTLLWSDMLTRLSVPIRSTETIETYMSLPRGEQDRLKDVGGFTGSVRDGKRKATHITGRDLITLDMDNIPPGATDEALKRIDSLNCAYCVYSTRKHTPAAPRLRIILPLDTTCSPDEYEPIARKLAEYIGIEWCDPTTYEASRLMYYPSCCVDGAYVYQYGDKQFLSRTGMLAAYKDWRNVSEWATAETEKNTHKTLITKQTDPLTKDNIVGAFCRRYNVLSVIGELLPDVYIPTDSDDRFTYTSGSTAGGAVIYENGTFLYSHHATDPCSGLLVNAFDLYRIHKYGYLDDDTAVYGADTPTHNLESYKAMMKFVLEDEEIVTELNKTKYNTTAAEAFKDILSQSGAENDMSWLSKIKRSAKTGAIEKHPDNVEVLLQYDPLLTNRIRKDSFADKIYGFAPLPWKPRSSEKGKFQWTDSDFDGLRSYIGKVLGFWTEDIIKMVFSVHAAGMQYNPVEDYIKSVTWDNVERLDTLIIDYLGADDNEYTRACTRKAFTAAVARVMQPGIKFDVMTILAGPQGMGKSTLLRKMGGDWFNDSITSFEGTKAIEIIQGSWIIEVGELQAMNKAEVNLIKQFLSMQEDKYRAAYARYVETRPRKCVFFGTNNAEQYLRDITGNRRFWCIDVYPQNAKYSVFNDLNPDIICQLWAEAYYRWQMGEPLYLTGEAEKQSIIEQEKHMEVNDKTGLIEEFLNKPIPSDWYTNSARWTKSMREIFLRGEFVNLEGVELVERTQVCTMEIWTDCLGGNPLYFKKPDQMEIGAIVSQIKGWEKAKSKLYFGVYGRLKGYKKVKSLHNSPTSPTSIL